MVAKTKPAILPRDLRDPTGMDVLERNAMQDFGGRMRRVGQAYRSALDRIPAEPVVNRRYTFRLDQALLRSLLAQLDLEVDSILLEGGEDRPWFFEQYVEVAATRGTAQAFANLAQQSSAYKAGRVSVQNILRSEPHQRRMALTRTRVFEEMKGLSAQAKTDMSRLLTDGIGRGLNPRDVARNLTEQAGIEAARANRIARTEITTALRRARWDEAEDAQEEYGLKTKLMHLSALSQTTRRSHAARHAKLYTVEEVRDWYSRDANSINCKCSQTEVMVDDEGLPLLPSIVERAQKAREKMAARGYAWAKKKD